MIRRTAFLAALLLACACTGRPALPTAEISDGKVRGRLTPSGDIAVFRGIPYAAPPVGDLRWRPPQAVEPWEGVFEADGFSDIAWQPGHEEGAFYQREFYFGDYPRMNEDCLYLNVWTPADAVGDAGRKLAVAVWIHGGAYINGYGHEVTMDGEEWARRDVILVTLNYRLGAAGFLPHPELSAESGDGRSGNYGTLDQIAALGWVRRNISAFGGDPDNITLMGQSAGASSVKNLIASPLSRDMIARAIIQSGGGMGRFITSDEDASALEALGREMMDAAGLTDLEKMRAAQPEQLLAAATGCYARGVNPMSFLSPHVDGYVLESDFTNAVLDGRIADIPYMIGSTADDIRPMDEPIDAFCMARDSLGSCPVYKYLFARPLPGDQAGAFHSSELWYMFHTLDRCPRPFTAGDYALSERMVEAWTDFAKYGDPNGAGDRKPWRPFTAGDHYVEVFDVD